MNRRWIWAAVAAASAVLAVIAVPWMNDLAGNVRAAGSAIHGQPPGDLKLNEKDFAAAGIALNMDWRKVRSVLGQPLSAGRERNEEIGTYFETWKYPGLQVTFMYSIEWGDAHPGQSGQVMFILLSDRQYQTARGIRPGDAREKVTTAYGAPSSEGDGTIYYDTDDGMSYLGFHLKGRKVTAIRIENTLY